MTMQIVDAIVSDGHGPLEAEFVCIHETANPGATAAQHVAYWSAQPAYAVHYVADWGPRVYRCVPEDRKCWQVGNGNGYVIGIELCHAINLDDFAKVWQTGVEWAAWALKAHGWGIDRLISHDIARQWWGGTDHTDPVEYFEAFGRSWAEFVADVGSALGGDDVITDADVARIAQASANYVWGLERGGESAINRLVGLPRAAAIEALGYTNERMNGDKDVYQLITDLTRRVAELDEAVQDMAEALQDLNDKVL